MSPHELLEFVALQRHPDLRLAKRQHLPMEDAMHRCLAVLADAGVELRQIGRALDAPIAFGVDRQKLHLAVARDGVDEGERGDVLHRHRLEILAIEPGAQLDAVDRERIQQRQDAAALLLGEGDAAGADLPFALRVVQRGTQAVHQRLGIGARTVRQRIGPPRPAAAAAGRHRRAAP
jgi:hypothetical protein